MTADNKILVFRGNTLIRLNADGMIDPTFVSGSNLTIPIDFALQPDGQIIVAGIAPPLAPPAVPRAVIRLLPSGAADATFNPIFSVDSAVVRNVGKVVSQPDNKVLVSGNYRASDGQTRRGIVRLNADGTQDFGFTPSASASVTDFELQNNCCRHERCRKQ